ncbi:MAG: NAD(P)-dependent alcohol dehydrogenase [Leptospiraceae bacterium]|nr:NAD(P)-dependent alcohol dehydrogenase [Leptospiraceae bacterium]MCP5512535.1 NAD(P)-dependent alcohol dehydrogenase [Leptospiraceae bacterium]
MIFNSYASLSKNEKLTPYTFESEEPGPMDCRIKVTTCGICHSDLHMIENNWRISKYPLVPGHEVVGRIVEVGKMVHHLKVGDRVGVGWQSEACMECPDCLRGDENLCSENKATIVGRHGGFADHIQVDSRFAFKIPDAIDSIHASPLLCAGITVYSALVSAGMGSGGRVGVIGVGGLGHLAIQFASKLGNRVTAFTTSPDKAEFAVNLGAHDVVLNPTSKDQLREKCNIILNTTHNDLDWSYFLNQLDSDGTLSFVGVPASPLKIHVGQLLAKRKKITASPIGGRFIMNEMLRISAEHEIFPVVEEFSKDEINLAIEKVKNNSIRYRAVVDFRK